jgi:hypothetical protein
MLADSSLHSERTPTARSAISNGTRLFAGVDGRSATARRFRDLLADLMRDLGGATSLTTMQHGLARQVATLQLQAEHLQAAVVRGDVVDSKDLVRVSGEARRILAGLQKRSPQAA